MKRIGLVLLIVSLLTGATLPFVASAANNSVVYSSNCTVPAGHWCLVDFADGSFTHVPSGPFSVSHDYAYPVGGTIVYTIVLYNLDTGAMLEVRTVIIDDTSPTPGEGPRVTISGGDSGSTWCAFDMAQLAVNLDGEDGNHFTMSVPIEGGDKEFAEVVVFGGESYIPRMDTNYLWVDGYVPLDKPDGEYTITVTNRRTGRLCFEKTFKVKDYQVSVS